MSAQATLSTTQQGYGHRHRQIRARYTPLVLAGGVRCVRCNELIRPTEPWDLGHRDGSKLEYAGPEHRRCNRATFRRRGWEIAKPPEPEPERRGLSPEDPRWSVPWLEGLRDVPADAVWPRLMTVPHPRAVGSLGPEFVRFAEERTGRPLRWWQRLTATRLLETDRSGSLVWDALVLSMARQLGKSWLLRELMLWRIQQGERFGEPQDVMHTGKDVAICTEVQRAGRLWAKARPAEFRVREVNGQEAIEFLADGSRWMIRAKGAVHGYTISLAAADEAWKVHQHSIDEDLAPTMVERTQAQLLLVSTAHRLATSLMLTRRLVALSELESGEGDLLIEWSAPRESELDELDAWKLASPHWTPQRERLISKRFAAMQAGEIDDPEEPDPVESFRAQWLNQWPRKQAILDGKVVELLPLGLWSDLTRAGLASESPLFVAIEDDYGLGAAVAAVARLDDGRLEVDGWLCEDWDSAISDVERLAALRQIRELHVGASLLDRLPMNGLPKGRPAVLGQTRAGLALVRDLATNGQLVHDETTRELDQALNGAKVRETLSGLQLVPQGPSHLVKAVSWAVAAAHRPARIPVIR